MGEYLFIFLIGMVVSFLAYLAAATYSHQSNKKAIVLVEKTTLVLTIVFIILTVGAFINHL